MSAMDEWLEKAKADADARKKAERASRPKGQKCSNCLHHRGHEFSPKYHYCKLGKSERTGNGFAKTMASGWCAKWEVKP
jgi:hypothetical protein